MNFKFLPFVIGMALASTAANAEDFSCSHLTVGKNTSSNSFVRINMDYGIAQNYFITADDKTLGSYTTMFSVSRAGHVSSTGWDVSGGSSTTTTMCPHLLCKINPNNARAFLFSTSGYQFKPEINFSAGGYTFDGGNMVVNGKITCKDELEVIGLTASTIKAEDINVNMNNAADYVFDENYNLKSLSEVESYVNEHKHLPGMPSAAEMDANGVSVSKMSNLLLEKVEELTLHMIKLEKENAALKARVQELEK